MIWNKMVSEHAKIVGVSESTAQWRLIAACIVLLAIGACVVISYVTPSLFQPTTNTETKNDTEHKEVTPPLAPARSFYVLNAGAPLCSSFQGAITAGAVMRSGNPAVIDAVLAQHGCETSSQRIEIDGAASVQTLQAGVIMINTPSGDRVYTTSGSIYNSSGRVY